MEDIKTLLVVERVGQYRALDSEGCTLSLVTYIADMMGFKRGTIPDVWLNTYHETMLSIPYDITPKEAHNRAVILYTALSII